jgi:hypothetical protein
LLSNYSVPMDRMIKRLTILGNQLLGWMVIPPYQTDLLQNDFGKSPLDNFDGYDTEIIIMQLPNAGCFRRTILHIFCDNGYLIWTQTYSLHISLSFGARIRQQEASSRQD